MPDSRPSTKTVSDDAAQNWMASFGVKKGEYLSVTKSQLKTQQRPDKPLKVQVWATGMLHTAGYQGQVAMTMRGGKKVPLAPNDIIKELHAAAIKYFRDGGIEATEEDLAKLRETKETIRRALQELEEDGVCQRTDTKDTPLSKLTPAELKRLQSGKTRLYFWLKPQNATAKTVAQEWAERQVNPPTPPVDKNRLLVPPIWKILNVFQIQKPAKSQLSDAQFQQRVMHAYDTARAAFLREIEVDIACLLDPVDTPRSHEVDTPGGAFEIKEERNSREEVGRKVEIIPPTDLLPAPLPELPHQNPVFREVVRVIAEHATPTIGEAPTRAQYLEIFTRLDGASPEHLRERIEAKKARGKLNSVMVLPYLADDCAKTKDSWRPQIERKPAGKKSFAESVTEEAERRLRKYGSL